MNEALDIYGVHSIEYYCADGNLLRTNYIYINSTDNKQGYNTIIHSYENTTKINKYYLNDDLVKTTYEIQMPNYLVEIYDYLNFDENVYIKEIEKTNQN